ncbi:hypothetical protein HK096_001796, partial [Nowakowskiella sp. JEL0078]
MDQTYTNFFSSLPHQFQSPLSPLLLPLPDITSISSPSDILFDYNSDSESLVSVDDVISHGYDLGSEDDGFDFEDVEEFGVVPMSLSIGYFQDSLEYFGGDNIVWVGCGELQNRIDNQVVNPRYKDIIFWKQIAVTSDVLKHEVFAVLKQLSFLMDRKDENKKLITMKLVSRAGIGWKFNEEEKAMELVNPMRAFKTIVKKFNEDGQTAKNFEKNDKITENRKFDMIVKVLEIIHRLLTEKTRATKR